MKVVLEVAWTETEEMGPERQEDHDETCDDKMTVKVRRDEYSTHSLANVTRLGTMSCATVTCAKARENLHKGIPIACKRNSLTKKRQRMCKCFTTNKTYGPLTFKRFIMSNDESKILHLFLPFSPSMSFLLSLPFMSFL